MTGSGEAIVGLPKVWASLLIAAILAVVFAYEWLTWGPEKWLDLRLFAFPIYAPLAFGVICPVLVALQAMSMPSPGQEKLRRNWVALIMFVVSAFGWVPVVMAEMKVAEREREEVVRQREWQQQRMALQAAAQQAIAEGGILAFSEPFQGEEGGVLERYIYEHHFSLEELQQASEHYQTTCIMNEIAQKPNCPAEALEILYAHANGQESEPGVVANAQLGPIYGSIAANPNITVALLVKMVQSDNPVARAAAVKNPKLPKVVKIAYLKKGCTEWWPSEISAIGADPDTPVDVLECLSKQQGAAYAVARNPHTPIRVIETMAASQDYWLKTAGQESLAKRRAAGQ
jgi:hypothetical protein